MVKYNTTNLHALSSSSTPASASVSQLATYEGGQDSLLGHFDLGVSDAQFRLSRRLLFSVCFAGIPERPSFEHRFASLTAALWQRFRTAGLRRTFELIDTQRRGLITETDLETYARSNGLPVSYVGHFISAVLKNAGCSINTPEREVDFGTFSKFVLSREKALRRAFNLFDRDKDGRISVEDLDSSLAHVAVCCPNTRCVYRCNRRGKAAELLKKAGFDSNRPIDFDEFRQFFLLLPQSEFLVEYWISAETACRTADLDTRVKLYEPSAKGSPWGHLFAGAVAGATSRTATAPLETLRLAAMTGVLGSTDLVEAAQRIVAAQGWQGLYKGNLVNVMRSAPSKALDFFVFDAYKRLLGEDGYMKTFIAAGLAGATSWIALYPLEVIRSTVVFDKVGKYRGPVHAAKMLVAAEGPAALYKGLGPSVAAIIPEAAITYGLHDLLKRLHRKLNKGKDPGVLPSLAFGVLSAFTGQLVSFPLEAVSRRLQVANVTSAVGKQSLTGVMSGLLKEGGPRALYRGLGAATLRLIPMAFVSFGTYELVRSLVIAWELQNDSRQARQEAELVHCCCPLTEDGEHVDKKHLHQS